MTRKSLDEFIDVSPIFFGPLISLIFAIILLGQNVHGQFFAAPVDLIWCTTHSSCIHEQAHFIDEQSGWISSSVEYRTAILVFVMTDPDNPWAKVADHFPVTAASYRELYATMFEAADGNLAAIPERLRLFYQLGGSHGKS